MALNSKNIYDLEQNKFVESPDRPGMPAVEVTGSTKILGADGSDLTTTIDGKSYINLISLWPMLAVDNNIVASYPTATREIYDFRKNTTVVLSLQVDYTTAAKNVFLEVRRIA